LDTIELSVSDNVAVVRLANPPVNAVSRLMMRELYESFMQLGERRDVGAVVLAAAGDRAFCGGVDLKERSGGAPDSQNQPPRQLIDSGREWRETQASIRHRGYRWPRDRRRIRPGRRL
jgi:enoyl-CoA hydratase